MRPAGIDAALKPAGGDTSASAPAGIADAQPA
jgi:hypothetical protein